MDIGELSTGMNQSIVKETTVTPNMNTTTETGKADDNTTIETTQNVAVDTNVGQHLDVVALNQIDVKEEVNRQQQQDMQWVQKKQKMMDIKEVTLLQMRVIAEQAIQSKLSPQEQTKLNDRLNILSEQVSAIDNNSKRTKEGNVV